MYRRDEHYGFLRMCPWDREAFEYEGACSHNLTVKPVLGDYPLTKEELESVAAEAKETNRLYQIQYIKKN
jgi:hypothetical protein